MHQAIHKDLKTYLVEDHSPAAYAAILEAARFIDEHFDSKECFSDTDLELVLGAAERELSMTRNGILAANGRKAAAGLLEAFQAMIDPGWKTLGLVKAVEGRMRMYSREELAAFPPVLKAEPVSDDELIVRSRSHRNLWSLAVGFIRGFADHYGESVTVGIETEGSLCRFTIRKAT